MAASSGSASVRYGAAGLIAGVLSAFGSFMVYATSTFLDPPGWVRIPAMALFPIGLLASLFLGAMAFRGTGRGAAVAGWVASLAGLALFVYSVSALR